MKISPLILGAISLAPAAFAQVLPTVANSQDWMVLLKQRHLEVPGFYQDFVDPEGNRTSFAPVPEGGSEFTLWAIRNTASGFEEHRLDTQLVGAYLPAGELTVVTPDPYEGNIPRTRIDQGFTVTHTVSGLVLNDPEAPLAARQVLFDHKVASYETQGNSGRMTYQDNTLGEEQEFAQHFIVQNGEDSVSFAAGNIPGQDPYHDAGVEIFRLYALPDGDIAQLELAEARVQVWPMAVAEITGLEDYDVYRTIPEVRVQLTNLYPDSTTWMQFYSGTENAGTEGTAVSGSSIVVSDVIPRDSELVFDRLNEIISSEGNWTLEVLTETPFGTERLAWRTIQVKKDLVVRGSLNTLGE